MKNMITFRRRFVDECTMKIAKNTVKPLEKKSREVENIFF